MEKSYIRKAIQTLSELRFKLKIKKLVKPTISSSDLKVIVTNANNNVDEIVKGKISEVFDEFFNKKDNKTLSFQEMQHRYSDSVTNNIDAKVPVIKPNINKEAAW